MPFEDIVLDGTRWPETHNEWPFANGECGSPPDFTVVLLGKVHERKT